MYDECLNLMNVNIGTASQRERREEIEHKHNTENQKKKKNQTHLSDIRIFYLFFFNITLEIIHTVYTPHIIY